MLTMKQTLTAACVCVDTSPLLLDPQNPSEGEVGPPWIRLVLTSPMYD